MKRLDEIVERLDALRAELLEIEEIEEPTEDDATRQSELLDEFDTLEAERKPLAERAERIERVRLAAQDPKNVVPGVKLGPEVIVKRENPFDNLDAVRAGHVTEGDVRSRALAAIEYKADGDDTPDDYRQAAAECMRTAAHPEGVARHILLTGSPAYRSAFEKFLRYPDTFGALLTGEEAEAMRTAMSTTDANGGYAIPFLLDPTLILTNAGVTNPIRGLSRVVHGVSNAWHGLTSAGVTAEWLGEGSAAADKSPTFGQPDISTFKAAAYVSGSYEVLEDTNLAADLPMLLADARDQLEADAFAVGSGSGAPKGVVTAVTAVTTSRVSPTTTGSFTTASRADVDAVINAVPPRHRSKSAWVANFSTYSVIRNMDTAGGASFWANLGAAVPQQLLGLPIYEASKMDATLTTTGHNVLLAGNFQNYVIYDRIGASVEYIPNVMDTTTGRPTGQRGYFLHWRVGADVVNADAFRVLKI